MQGILSAGWPSRASDESGVVPADLPGLLGDFWIMSDRETSATDSTGASPAESGHGENRERKMMPMYAAVVAVEIVVLLALWIFARHFGS